MTEEILLTLLGYAAVGLLGGVSGYRWGRRRTAHESREATRRGVEARKARPRMPEPPEGQCRVEYDGVEVFKGTLQEAKAVRKQWRAEGKMAVLIDGQGQNRG